MQSSLTQKDQAVNEHCNTVSDEYMAIENRVNRKFPTWWSSCPLTYKKNNLYSSCFFFSFLIIFLILITCIYVSNHLAFPVQRSGRTSKSNKNITENSNFLTPLFGSIQNKEKTEPDKLSYSWRTPKFETMQCSKILVPSFSLHFLPNQTRSFSLVTYWVECQPSTWSYHSYSWQDTAQMGCFSRNLRVGWIKQYAKKPRNQKMHVRIFVIIKNEKKKHKSEAFMIAWTWRESSWKFRFSQCFQSPCIHQVEALVESLIFLWQWLVQVQLGMREHSWSTCISNRRTT